MPWSGYSHSKIICGLAVAGLVALTSSCSSPSPTNSESKVQFSDRQIVTDFADRVVIPTYQVLLKRSEDLSGAVNTFVNNPNDQTLQGARDTWIAARTPWEQSEAFAFGPADSLGYDGDLDDWPVNETDVKAVLKSNDKLTPEYIKNLQTTQKGFHTMELLLFGVDNNKKAADFSKQELAYLQGLTVAFNQTASDLVTSWSQGVQGNPAYREVLATAGESDNRSYPTLQAGAEEIVQGMLGCLDEVANEKIGEPLKTKDTEGLESRFSHSSLNDFKNNLISVQNAYLGKVSNANSSGKGLSSFVAEVNPELDGRIQKEIQASIDAVAAIPAPIETQINNEEALGKMEAAQKAILTLHSTVEQEVLPLVQG